MKKKKTALSPYLKAAIPHKGFGSPRRWVQTIFTAAHDEGDRFDGFNGPDEAIHQLCVKLLQSEVVELVLIIEGSASQDDVSLREILADYSKEDSGDDSQQIAYAYS